MVGTEQPADDLQSGEGLAGGADGQLPCQAVAPHHQLMQLRLCVQEPISATLRNVLTQYVMLVLCGRLCYRQNDLPAGMLKTHRFWHNVPSSQCGKGHCIHFRERVW